MAKSKGFDPTTAVEFDPNSAVEFDPSTASEYRPGYPNAPTFPMPKSPIAQLGSDVVAPFKQYANDFVGGASRIASGDPFGGLQIGSGAAELAMGVVPNTILSLAKQGSPEMAAGANIAEGVMGGVGNLVNKAVGYTPVGLGAGYLKDKGVISPQQEQDINRAQSNVAMIAGGALIPKAISGAAARSKVRAFEKGNVAMERIAPSLSKELSRPKDYSRMAGYLAEEEIKVPTKVGRAHKGSVVEPSAVDQIATQKFPKIKQRIYSEQDAVIQRNANAPLVGGVDEIAANVESLKNIFTENIDLLKNKSILDEAAKYRAMGDITLSQARELQRALNANLQELYKKSAESQVATENMAKPIAEMEKAAESIREQIVKTLDANGEKGSWYRDKSLDYGAAVRLEVATERNVTRSRAPTPHWLTPNSASFYPSRPGIVREVGEQTIGRLHSVNKDAVAAMRNYKKSGLRAPGAAPPPIRPTTIPPPGGSPPPKGFTPPVPPRALPSQAPLDEAPVSMGGNMNVRGRANQAQIDKYYLEGKLTEEQAIKFGVSPNLLRKR